MIGLLLFFLGVYGVAYDLLKGRRGALAIMWNNFRYYTLYEVFFWLTVTIVVVILQIETYTGVISTINNSGLFGQIQILILTTGFLFIVMVFAIILMLTDLPYKRKVKK